MDIGKKIMSFIKFWYMRYLLATELYMVEPWEKVVIHIIFALVFSILLYFNYNIVINAIGQLRSAPMQYTRQMI